MVAWRARIGLIKPTHRGKSFAFWYKHAVMQGLSFSGQGEGLYTTPLLILDEVSHMDVYRHCKRGVQQLGSVDAIYINGGGWDAAQAIEPLEQDLKLKVVWALAAEMWFAYHKLKISNPVSGLGSLLTGKYEPVS